MGWWWGHGERVQLLSWNQKGDSACRGVGTDGAETGVSILETTELRLLSTYCGADPHQALDTHDLCLIFTTTWEGSWQMGWDSERLRNLPKVTKLLKEAEPEAKPFSEGRQSLVHWSLCFPASVTDSGPAASWPPALLWLRILMNKSDNPWNGKAGR